MPKFKEKYRSESHRLKDRDYSSSGFYFVTVNTQNRQQFFGEINSGIMTLSPVGQLVAEKINYMQTRHPNVRIDDFVIMPNHVHLVVHLQSLNGNVTNAFHPPIRNGENDKTTQNQHHHWQWKPGVLGSVINQFKGDLKKSAKTIDPLFNWQSNYNDSVIWDVQSYLTIKDYIKDNPKNYKG